MDFYRVGRSGHRAKRRIRTRMLARGHAHAKFMQRCPVSRHSSAWTSSLSLSALCSFLLSSEWPSANKRCQRGGGGAASITLAVPSYADCNGIGRLNLPRPYRSGPSRLGPSPAERTDDTFYFAVNFEKADRAVAIYGAHLESWSRVREREFSR